MAYNRSNTKDWKQLDIIEYFKGWERVLYDKCRDNSVSHIQTVNMPQHWGQVNKRSRETGKN